MSEIDGQKSVDAVKAAGSGKVLSWGRKPAAVVKKTDTENTTPNNVTELVPKEETAPTLMVKVGAFVFGGGLVGFGLVMLYFTFARRAPLLVLFAITFLLSGIKIFGNGLKGRSG